MVMARCSTEPRLQVVVQFGLHLFEDRAPFVWLARLTRLCLSARPIADTSRSMKRMM